MNYEQLTELEDEAFKRYCGVRCEILGSSQQRYVTHHKVGRFSLNVEVVPKTSKLLEVLVDFRNEV